jgi:methionine synthase II (cobalamin-independent)
VKATGIGSLPGDDIDAAMAFVFTELPDFPHLPELPARGPGADMVGRTAAALADPHVDLQPSGWRLVARAGLDEARARRTLEQDLDALVPVAATHDGPLKVQLAGPWTLAASLQTERGPALADAGAVRDLVASLAETVREHLADVRRRSPHAQLTLQLDEPSLPAVLAGAVPTTSGLSRVRAVPAPDAESALRDVVDAAGVPVVVHCCAAEVPLAVVHAAGATAVSLDFAVARVDRDVLGQAVEDGLQLWAGIVPALGPGAPPSAREIVAPVRRLFAELGLGPDVLRARVVLTPACGLAGASSGWASTALRLVRQAAKVLDDAPEAAPLRGSRT